MYFLRKRKEQMNDDNKFAYVVDEIIFMLSIQTIVSERIHHM